MKLHIQLLVLCVGLLLVGCGGSDADEDLLSDRFEQALGTNYQIADSDGDGFTDAAEYLAYFNPQNDEDYPYEGGYQRLPSPENYPDDGHEEANPINGNGWREGDISQNWEAEDQFHDLFQLHDFYGQVIMVAIGESTQTQAAAARADAYNDFGPDGLIIIDILVDDVPVDPDGWAEDNGITHIVIEDSDQEYIDEYIVLSPENTFSIPNFTTIGRDMEIKDHYRAGQADFNLIQDLLDEDPPDVYWPLPSNVSELRDQLEIEVTAPEPFIQENIARGAEIGGSASGGGGGGGGGGGADGTYVNPTRSDGSYAGPPFGGDNCSAAGSGITGLPGLALVLLTLLVRRRRA